MPASEQERVTLEAYGCCVAVDLPPSLTPSLWVAMPPGYGADSQGLVPQRCWRVSSAPDRMLQAFADGGLLITHPDASVVLAVMMADLELWVAEHSPQFVFVHAGCVAVDGRAIVLPGRTMMGKSTLVVALIEAGATYYSDEYALIDSEGLVWPYPRRLSIRPSGEGRPRRLAWSEVGAPVGGPPVRIGLVASLRYEPEAGWEVHQVRQGEAVLSLIDNAVAARRSPEAVLTSLVAATGGAVAVSGTRDGADTAACRLLDLVRPQEASGALRGLPSVGSAQ